MVQTIEVTRAVTLTVEECPVCFIHYAVPSYLLNQRQEKGGHWYCPAGHSIQWTTSTRQQLDEERLENQRLRTLLHDEHATVSRLAKDVAEKDQTLKRLNRRARAGVCQFCHRTFQNVARHMVTKHERP